MTRQELDAVIDGQLAADLGLEPDVWDTPGRVTAAPWREDFRRRRYRAGHPFFLGHIRRGAAAFAVHEHLLPWAREYLTGLEPAWCLDSFWLSRRNTAFPTSVCWRVC